MIKTMLVPLAGGDGDAVSMASALALARTFDAHVEALHIRLDPMAAISSMAYADLGSGRIIADMIDRMERESAGRAERARATFEAGIAREGIAPAAAPPGPGGPSAARIEVTGDEIQEIARRAAFHDLVVMARGHGRSGLSVEVIEQALMFGGRPLLIVPATAPATFAGPAVVAWKHTPEAARAVTAAMPFLALASRVEVLTIAEAGSGEEAHEVASLDGVVAQLGWHGFRAAGRRIESRDRSGADALFDAAREAGAGLVVMGGYGRSRLREMIFGGFTQRVLDHADVPVLMFH